MFACVCVCMHMCGVCVMCVGCMMGVYLCVCVCVSLHRYLFSMERNRRVFKKLFPPELFVAFIDIGHYTSSLSAYSQLVHTINALSVSVRCEV